MKTIFNIIYTGIDGSKSYSICVNPLKRTWFPSSKEGKKIYLIPSDLCFIKIEKSFTNKISQLYSYYSLEVEKKFGNLPFDISVIKNNIVYLGIHKDFEGEDFYSIELEPFALARVFSLISKEGYVVDFGRRKTTFVYIENGLLKSYRVVMKGYDYLKELIKNTSEVSFEEAGSILVIKGIESEYVREGIHEIIKQSGYEIYKSPIVLSGGGAYINSIKKLFPNSLSHNFCSPELTSAFGASLKYALKNPYPSFMKETLNKEEIKKIVLSLSLSILIFIVSLFAIDKIYSIDALKEMQKKEFKKVFPKTPVISLQEQLINKFSKGEKYEFTNKLNKFSEIIKEGITVISFEYKDGVLNIKGEGKSETVSQLKTKSTKQTNKGTVEFEVEIR